MRDTIPLHMERALRLDAVPVVVAGGITCDLAAESAASVRRYTSNPGRVHLSPGGVARNIAETIARLEVPVTLLGVVGEDPLSSWTLERTAAAGVDVRGVVRLCEGRVGLYVSIMSHGELDTAVSDMSSVETLEPEAFRAMLDRAVVEVPESGAAEATTRGRREAHSILVMDCNLSVEALQAGLDWARGRDAYVVVEPVSVEKARRLCGVSGRIDVVTPNADEFVAVLHELFRPGGADIQCCIVTRGERGAASWRPGEPEALLYPTEPVPTANANGAGDAFVAGLVAGLSRGLSHSDSIALGLAAGRRTAAASGTVHERLRLDELLREVEISRRAQR
ncbi:MAG: PfkB family carbohydrate kinase [Spirochaetales bacterium]|nr:PfkB family carbohydrate kinase [Spirochaetales bacterium]